MCSQLQCLSLEGGLDGWVPYQELCSFPNIARLSKVDTWHVLSMRVFFQVHSRPKQGQSSQSLDAPSCIQVPNLTNGWPGEVCSHGPPAQIVTFFQFCFRKPFREASGGNVSHFCHFLIPWLGPLRFAMAAIPAEVQFDKRKAET